jgi:hypothetical protein
MITLNDQTDLDALSSAERQQMIKEFLVCPKCGYAGAPEEGDGFRCLEDIVCFRPVVGARDGLLKIVGLYVSGEGYDDGTNLRLECRRFKPEFCGHEWPIPDWLMPYLDWVD